MESGAQTNLGPREAELRESSPSGFFVLKPRAQYHWAQDSYTALIMTPFLSLLIRHLIIRSHMEEKQSNTISKQKYKHNLAISLQSHYMSAHKLWLKRTAILIFSIYSTRLFREYTSHIEHLENCGCDAWNMLQRTVNGMGVWLVF